MINRHIILSGSGRTGTSGMTRLFQRLIGSENVDYGENILNQINIKSYNLNSPPKKFIEIVQHKKEIIDPDKPYFNGNWEMSMVMYLMEQTIPSVRFFVNLRDPLETVASLKHRRWNKIIKSDKEISYDKFCQEKSDEVYLDEWIVLYRFILKQIERMEHKPFLIYFDWYIKSVYNQLFLDLYGLNKNPRKIREFLNIKINTSFDKKRVSICDKKVNMAYDIMSDVILLCQCQNNWIIEELNGKVF